MEEEKKDEQIKVILSAQRVNAARPTAENGSSIHPRRRTADKKAETLRKCIVAALASKNKVSVGREVVGK